MCGIDCVLHEYCRTCDLHTIQVFVPRMVSKVGKAVIHSFPSPSSSTHTQRYPTTIRRYSVFLIYLVFLDVEVSEFLFVRCEMWKTRHQKHRCWSDPQPKQLIVYFCPAVSTGQYRGYQQHVRDDRQDQEYCTIENLCSPQYDRTLCSVRRVFTSGCVHFVYRYTHVSLWAWSFRWRSRFSWYICIVSHLFHVVAIRSMSHGEILAHRSCPTVGSCYTFRACHRSDLRCECCVACNVICYACITLSISGIGTVGPVILFNIGVCVE